MKSITETVLEQLNVNDKYNKILESVDEKTKKQIDNTVKNFITQLSENFEKVSVKLSDDEVRKAVAEHLRKSHGRWTQ